MQHEKLQMILYSCWFRKCRECYLLYATSGNTRSTSHKEIQDVRHIRKCYVCLKNNIYATSGDTICRTPHQEIQKVRHIREYRIQDIRHITKCYVCVKNNIYATSGDTIYCTPHQEIQEIRHIRKYRMYAISGNAMYVSITIYTPHQDIQYITKYEKYATSGNTGCTPYQEILRTIYTPHQEIQEVRHFRKYGIYTISLNVTYVWRTIYTPHQSIQYIVRHTKKDKKHATSGNTVCCTPFQEMQEICNIR